MEVVNVSDITPGRTLAKAVLSTEGALVFPSGVVLTEAHLAALRQWGVDNVTLTGAQGDPQSEQPEDLRLAVQESMVQKFCRHDLNNPHIKAVFNLAVERQSRILLGTPGKISLKSNPAPAFRTERPPKVSLSSLLEAGHQVGTLPAVFQRLLELIDDPEVSTEALAAVIATDQALTARLLRLVNSPFFGLSFKIDSISRAVVIVGTRQLVLLAMSAILVSTFRGLPVSLVNMQSFWFHSLSCGSAARLLARHTAQPLSESFFVAGLLHDIARLLIYSQLPKHALYMLTEARHRQETLRALERETLGFTHEALGAELLSRWNCPRELVLRVGRHHVTPSADGAVDEMILPAADMLSQAVGYGSSGETMIPALPDDVWKRLKLTPEALLELCAQLDETMRSLRFFFEM